ncbi:ATP-binding protein [Streptomyces sp. NPDC059193]|uniref:ATP-binding protein n=1 Tax=Streptomyces sp. NPDC059193 TaxID=3346763 RepID=UPI003680D149
MVLDLDLTEHSIHHARRMLVEGVRMWGLEELASDLGLVVTELLTNTMLHALGPDGAAVGRARCLVQRVPSGLVAVVHDEDPRLPEGRRGDVDALGGRGLHIVRQLAANVAITPSPGGGKDVVVMLSGAPYVLAADGVAA